MTSRAAQLGYLPRLEPLSGDEPTMARWRKRLFIAMSQVTADAPSTSASPRGPTVIMGSNIDV